MWNDKQTLQSGFDSIVQSGVANIGGALKHTVNAPQEYGLGSVIRDLDKEVGIACELAYNLTSILGVSNPPSDTVPAQGASGYFGAVSDALNRLRYANQNLSRAIQHLNS